jgi:hypothetical protein
LAKEENINVATLVSGNVHVPGYFSMTNCNSSQT